ncbi:MAG: hypothetical protein SW833_07650 [Cyanobacteriota bacterium]|nr:hypothetical protein [Cyanobacteriota bacterium]
MSNGSIVWNWELREASDRLSALGSAPQGGPAESVGRFKQLDFKIGVVESARAN